MCCEAGSDVYESVSNECLIGIRGRRGAKTLGVVGTHVASVVVNIGLRLVVPGEPCALGWKDGSENSNWDENLGANGILKLREVFRRPSVRGSSS